MKSKIFVIVIATLIVLPVLYLVTNELKYRSKHGNEPVPVNNILDSTIAPNGDTIK